ncbi:MAG: WD40 repeat domain-containing protein [Gemmataceae bacterium]
MMIHQPETGTIGALAFSPDGETLAIGYANGGLWNLDNYGDMAPAASATLPTPGFTSITFTPTGQRALGGPGGWRWDGATAALVHERPTVCLATLGPDHLVVGEGSTIHRQAGRLELWNLTRQQRLMPFFQEPQGVRAIATHSPSRRIAWANPTKRVSVWDITKPDAVPVNLPHVAHAIAFDPTGQFLAIAQDRSILIYDLTKKLPAQTLRGHKGQIRHLHYSAAYSELTSSSWDGTVRAWNTATGEQTRELNCQHGAIAAFAASVDGTRFAIGTITGEVLVWDRE